MPGRALGCNPLHLMSNGTSIASAGGTIRKAASGKAFGRTATGRIWRCPSRFFALSTTITLTTAL